MEHHRFPGRGAVLTAAAALWLSAVGVFAMDLDQYATATQSGRRLSENLSFNAQGQVLDQWTETAVTDLVRQLELEENRYLQLLVIGFDACDGAAGLKEEVARRTGAGALFIAPKADCVSPAPAEKTGRIEVWLVPVDDGA